MPDRFWIGTGFWDSTNTANWSASSGGSGGAPVPTASDDVYFDAASGTGTCTISISGIKQCKSINFRGLSGTSDYGGTFVLTAGTFVTIGLNITLSPSMTFNGTGTFVRLTSGGILTSNNKIFTGSLQLTNGNGFTTLFADNWTINGSLVNVSNPSTVNSSPASTPRTLTIGGSILGTAGINSNGNSNGVITYVMTGTTSTAILSGTLSNSTIEINAPGQTITQNALTLTNCVFTYTNGVYNSTASITMTGNSTFNNVSSINFHSFVAGGGGGASITINSNMNILNNLTVTNGSGSGFSINGSFNFNVAGNILLYAFGLAGTSTIVMNGSTNAFITHTSTGTSAIQNNLTINKSGGAIVTVDPALTLFTWGAANRTLTAVSSTQFNPGTSTIATLNNVTVNISENIKFYNFNPGSTVTINII